MATVRCESCGAEQEVSLLGDSDPACENCGSRTLTQVEDENSSATPDASPSETADTPERPSDPRAARPEEVPFSPGTLFGILADDRQRYVLYYLLEEDGRGTLADAVDQLTAWETETSVDALDEDARRSTSVHLYHAVFPKLDDCGLVDFDPETETVTATGRLRQIRSFLDFAQAAEPDDYGRFLELLYHEDSGDAGR